MGCNPTVRLLFVYVIALVSNHPQNRFFLALHRPTCDSVKKRCNIISPHTTTGLIDRFRELWPDKYRPDMPEYEPSFAKLAAYMEISRCWLQDIRLQDCRFP